MLDREHHVTLGASGSESADMLKQRPCGPMTPQTAVSSESLAVGNQIGWARGGFLANLIPKDTVVIQLLIIEGRKHLQMLQNAWYFFVYNLPQQIMDRLA